MTCCRFILRWKYNSASLRRGPFGRMKVLHASFPCGEKHLITFMGEPEQILVCLGVRGWHRALCPPGTVCWVIPSRTYPQGLPRRRLWLTWPDSSCPLPASFARLSSEPGAATESKRVVWSVLSEVSALGQPFLYLTVKLGISDLLAGRELCFSANFHANFSPAKWNHSSNTSSSSEFL